MAHWDFKENQKVKISDCIELVEDTTIFDAYRGQELTVLEKKEETVGIVEHYYLSDEKGKVILGNNKIDPFPFIDADLQAINV